MPSDAALISKFLTDLIDDELKHIPVAKWGEVVQEKRILRMVHTVKYTDGDTQDIFARPRTYTKVYTKNVVRRVSQIELRLEDRWLPLFNVAESDIPRAGLGLFAARDYPQGSTLGIYLGSCMRNAIWVRRKGDYGLNINLTTPDGKLSGGPYDATPKGMFVVDPTWPLKNKKVNPIFFGLHYCNQTTAEHKRRQAAEETTEPPKKKQARTAEDDSSADEEEEASNVVVYNDLSCVSTRNISSGEELILDYNTVYFE